MSNEMDNPVQSYMPVKLMSFKSDESGDEVCCDTGLLELTDSGNGFVEIGFDYGDERIYLGFRLGDLLRAVKEQAQP